MQVKAYYQLDVTDKDGNSIKKTRLKRSRSFTKWFARWLSAWFRYTGNFFQQTNYLTDTSNTARTVFVSTSQAMAYFGRLDEGIVFGSSNTAFNPEQVALGSKITSGHTYVSFTTTLNEQSTYSETVIESIRANNSGSTFNIREIGIEYRVYDSSNNQRIFLFARDVLSETLEVPNNYNIKITYRIRVTY